jgi:uncharacterized protein (TIRG00374 family)
VSAARLLRLAVAILLTAYILWKADPAAVARASAGAELTWILTAVALVLLDRALMAYRWIGLLGALSPGTRPPLAEVMRIFFVSTFTGTFLPSVGADMYRAYLLAQLNVRPAESAASVLIDRVLGVVSMVLVAAAALFFLSDRDIPGLFPALALAAAGCVAAAAAVFSERAALLAVRAAEQVPLPYLHHVARGLTDAVRRYADHRGALLSVLALSIGVQILRVVQAYCLGRALGIDATFMTYLAFIPVIVLVMQIPITISGLGTSQYAFEWLFGRAGVPSPQSVALSILFIALGIIGNLPGAILYVFGTRPTPTAK